jgi:hypothetical protein
MAFTSKLYRNEIIINDDDSTLKFAEPSEGVGRGLILDRRGSRDYEYEDLASRFPDELLIPRSDWQGMIKEQEEQQSRVSDYINRAKLPHKDQGSTNYCWINAPVHCVEITRLIQNQKTVILSPASVGAKIKNYRNVGGWGREGLEGIVQWGLVPVSNWPANAIDRQYDTAANRQLALNYRVIEWYECIPRNLDQMVSLLLRRKAGAAGLNWWRHEVTYCECVWLDGQIAVRARNSWKGYGDFGFFILQGSKMLPDDYVTPSSALAS